MNDDHSIERLAADWLQLERLASEQRSTPESAVLAAAAYEEALQRATPEDLLLAWKSASRIRDECELGGREWAEAREVVELLRMEYEASRG